jgi:hypothetical protein
MAASRQGSSCMLVITFWLISGRRERMAFPVGPWPKALAPSHEMLAFFR